MIDIDSISKKIALRILAEEFSDEQQQQDDIEREIKKQGLEAPEKKDKSTLQDEGEEDAEEKIDPKPVPEEKDDDEEEGGDFEVEAVEKEELPTNPTVEDIEHQINNLRAGRSLKDQEVSDQLSDYFERLGQAEERSLFVFLSSLAAILTGGTSGEEAPRPETMGVDIEMKPAEKPSLKKKPGIPSVTPSGEQAPIVVGERADTSLYKMRVLEGYTAKDKHRCLNGRVVGFGTRACVKDLTKRVEDATITRDSCGTGSADRASLNGTLKYLRQKLRAAQKIQSAS